MQPSRRLRCRQRQALQAEAVAVLEGHGDGGRQQDGVEGLLQGQQQWRLVQRHDALQLLPKDVQDGLCRHRRRRHALKLQDGIHRGDAGGRIQGCATPPLRHVGGGAPVVRQDQAHGQEVRLRRRRRARWRCALGLVLWALLCDSWRHCAGHVGEVTLRTPRRHFQLGQGAELPPLSPPFPPLPLRRAVVVVQGQA